MSVYGATQIYLTEMSGTVREVQAACRVWELRGFEVLSVGGPAAAGWLITMRASSTLYVNWLMSDTRYQAGPYDGQEAAEAAERSIILNYGLDRVTDSYVTAQRDHERVYIGDVNA
jgi:hypothetical protein